MVFPRIFNRTFMSLLKSWGKNEFNCPSVRSNSLSTYCAENEAPPWNTNRPKMWVETFCGWNRSWIGSQILNASSFPHIGQYIIVPKKSEFSNMIWFFYIIFYVTWMSCKIFWCMLYEFSKFYKKNACMHRCNMLKFNVSYTRVHKLISNFVMVAFHSLFEMKKQDNN